jgi:hypothetical protein
LGVSGRIRVAAKGGPAGDRIGCQKPADIRGGQSAQDELTPYREQAGFREVDLERQALAVSLKGHRAQLDLGVEVLSRRFAGRAEASAQLGRALERAGRRADAVSAYRKGLEVATRTGDLQTKKEIEVFLRRLESG